MNNLLRLVSESLSVSLVESPKFVASQVQLRLALLECDDLCGPRTRQSSLLQFGLNVARSETILGYVFGRKTFEFRGSCLRIDIRFVPESACLPQQFIAGNLSKKGLR